MVQGRSDPPIEGRLQARPALIRTGRLADADLVDLVAELISRADAGVFNNDATVQLALALEHRLAASLDVSPNRFSAQRYHELFQMLARAPGATTALLAGATVVDLGCGSVNPFGHLFLYLMLGARRGIAVDPLPADDLPRAVQAMADLAALLVVDPQRVIGSWPASQAAMLRNVASFDLGRLKRGDAGGIDTDRLLHLNEPVDNLSVESGSADVVISNAVLEHVADVEAAVAALARITRSGGLHVHNIDGADHRRYSDPTVHPLEFLCEEHQDPLPHGCNRVRPLEFIPLFERYGFVVLRLETWETATIEGAIRQRFVEPFRGLPDDILRSVGCTLYLRRL